MRVACDDAFLKEMFYQLALNACEAMDNCGVFNVTARERKDGSIVIKVSDTGKGIPEKDIPLIYDPFYTTKNRGAGVGLTIVLRILETHSGSIYVESEAGQGTIFTIILPAHKMAQVTSG
ncbi:MAG: ATP-binding protein, partial [Pseudomonadota bacterium]